MHSASLISVIAAIPAAMACLGYDGGLPTATGSKSLSEPQYIGAGETFDAGWVKYDRGESCTGQSEGGEADTVFVLEEGATLKNVIIGADQKEGVYCLGSCNLEFVWFENVCEDAISIKGSGTANIIGGGAYGADDKVIQHNGCGHVNVINFYANDYGKVYRSCGNCKGNCARSVHMEGVTAVGGGELMGINTNMGDTATYDNNCYPGVQCQAYEGCDKSNGDCEPTKLGEC
ncbi:family 3 polysaccharide lyase [Thelonectria olida]|uniref:Pectate lyase n=1 Tax=Thelonectria olida TaxID=1576542 RepID=A0A9P8WAP5_9HYPO|nr:family 3 polysaccharide lyase [Thelonectria olida]